jgi:hypothetical protein
VSEGYPARKKPVLTSASSVEAAGLAGALDHRHAGCTAYTPP